MLRVLNRPWVSGLLMALLLTLLSAVPAARTESLPAAEAAPPLAASDEATPRSGSVRILLYHHFAATENATTIAPERLEQHLQAMTAAGYKFIAPAQFEAFLAGEADLPSLSALVTIDDGYASIYEEALPVLVKHQVPALVFLVTGQVDRAQPGALPKLSRDQITALTQTGLFTFSGHGSNHGNPTVAGRSNLTRPFPDEPAGLFNDRVESDLGAMQALLTSVGGSTAHFAFPYGHVSASLDAALRQQGVRYAYTTEPGVVTAKTDRLRLPRFNAGAGWVTGELLLEALAGGSLRFDPEPVPM